MKSAKAEGLVLRAAIYARKSNDEGERAAKEKSVTQQIDAAKRFIQSQGWSVAPDSIYKDDAVSGALTVGREGFEALARAATAKRFDVVVVDDQDRIARAGVGDTERMVERLEKHGVAVYDTSGVRISFEDDDSEMPTTMRAMFAKWERKQTRKRVKRALAAKARNGYSTGGDVYGYRRERCGPASQGRDWSWVEFRIEEEQAEVVRQIFRMYAAGYGPMVIAKTLNGDPDHKEQSKKFFNGEHPEKPRVGKRGCGSWAPSAIHAMLRNERYAGVIVYGRVKRTGKYRDDGKPVRVKQRDHNAILRTPCPDLRIVPHELWHAVQKRIAAERAAYLASTNGNLFGRPDMGRDSKYLLSGLVRCGVCGGSMTANVQHSGNKGNRRRLVVFLCGYRNNRGKTACSNSLRLPEPVVNQQVLDAMASVMRPDVLRAAVRRALARAKDEKRERADPDAAKKRVAKLEAERGRLVAAIRKGGALDSLVEALSTCENALRDARAAAEAVRPAGVIQLSERRLEQRLTALAADWKRLMGKGSAESRAALRTFLPRPIELIPEGEGQYLLRGETLLGTPYDWCRGRDSNPHSVATART